MLWVFVGSLSLTLLLGFWIATRFDTVVTAMAATFVNAMTAAVPVTLATTPRRT
jgi:hypothetical protein